MNIESINSTTDSLKAIYTVLLALSLGEAFSQLVEKNPNAPDNSPREIRLDRIANLVPFVLLIIPFIQGMDRYFFDRYHGDTRPTPYAGHLLWDCVVFTLEGSLFFILARSLTWDRWKRFYGTVMTLLALDALWGLTVFFRFHPPAVLSWIILDFATLLVVVVVCFIPKGWVPYFRQQQWAHWWFRPVVALVIMVIRTVADYYLAWGFYFPSA